MSHMLWRVPVARSVHASRVRPPPATSRFCIFQTTVAAEIAPQSIYRDRQKQQQPPGFPKSVASDCICMLLMSFGLGTCRVVCMGGPRPFSSCQLSRHQTRPPPPPPTVPYDAAAPHMSTRHSCFSRVCVWTIGASAMQ